MLTLYDADRCPFCARVRIVLAEKGIEYEDVQIDLADRPAWLYEKNPLGKVPVLEDGDLAERVLLVQPSGPVGEVDLDVLVLDALLGEHDPDARAEGAPIGVVE